MYAKHTSVDKGKTLDPSPTSLCFGLLLSGGNYEIQYKKDGGTRRKFWKEPLRGANKILFYGREPLREKKKKEPLRGTNKILFCGRGSNFFSPLKPDTNSCLTNYLLSYIFGSIP